MSQQVMRGSKYRWLFSTIDMAAALKIAAEFNLAVPVAQVLVARGMTSHDTIRSFLFSTSADVGHASGLKDASLAVERIITALHRGESMLVCGDYDVDGITSSAMMMSCLLPLGAKINFFLPHRVRDGYGLSSRTIERAAKSGYKLLITVDNGITAIEQARLAKQHGIDLIITDHHRPHAQLPEAYAIVNPNQPDCPYLAKSLAGVGVTFKIMQLLYEKLDKQLPAKVYELLLLGTIADVVPLLGENRFWVRHGLGLVNENESLALRTLKKNGQCADRTLSSQDIGFYLAPQINALGRLEDPRQGVQFLLSSKTDDVEKIGKILVELNEARKQIERGISAEVEQRVASGVIDLAKERIILAISSEWAPGVVGLVASRIVGKYGRPTLLLHATKSGLAKGSCRSIAGFDMFNALSASSHLLEQFGGHSQAAGLAIKIENIPAFKECMEGLIAQQLTDDDLVQRISVDAVANLRDIGGHFWDSMQQLEPFGNANDAPVFCFSNLNLLQKPTLLKGAHVKCMLVQDGVIKPVIFFNRPELFEPLLEQFEKPLSVLAHVRQNHFNGRVSLELTGLDVSIDCGRA